mmetsp:Transcript_7114/g.18112  ORF Transcript_7114/g.18112 Transcript_7114/m.18112 type:complete len:256 (-) Transcript_7114:2713-3480(-)
MTRGRLWGRWPTITLTTPTLSAAVAAVAAVAVTGNRPPPSRLMVGLDHHHGGITLGRLLGGPHNRKASTSPSSDWPTASWRPMLATERSTDLFPTLLPTALIMQMSPPIIMSMLRICFPPAPPQRNRRAPRTLMISSGATPRNHSPMSSKPRHVQTSNMITRARARYETSYLMISPGVPSNMSEPPGRRSRTMHLRTSTACSTLSQQATSPPPEYRGTNTHSRATVIRRVTFHPKRLKGPVAQWRWELGATGRCT